MIYTPEVQAVQSVAELVVRSEKLIHYSPSQLTKYGLPTAFGRTGCRRKWWYQYVDKDKPPKTKSQLRGTRIHGVGEHSIRDGVVSLVGIEIECDRFRGTRAVIEQDDVNRGRAALMALARIEAAGDDSLMSALRASPAAIPPNELLEWYLDRASTAYAKGEIHVESEMMMPLPGTEYFRNRVFKGAVDLIDLRDPECPVITDYKTLSDMKYARTEYELAEDPQMLAYGRWVLGFTQAPKVKLRHIVIPTRGAARGVPAAIEVDAQHVESRWQTYLPVLDEMDLIRQAPDACLVPADGYQNGECDAYGGCFHRVRCGGALFRRVGDVKMTNPTLTTKLLGVREHAQRQRGATGAQPQPPATGMPTGAPPPVDAGIAALQQLGGANPQNVVPLQAPQAAPQAPTPEPAQSLAPPPMAPPAPPAAPQTANPGLAALPPAAPQHPAPISGGQPAPVVHQQVIQPPPGGVGMQAGAVAMVASTPGQLQQLNAQPESVVVEVAKSGAPNHASRMLVLFVDVPDAAQVLDALGAQYERFEQWIAPALETIRQAHGHGWEFHKYNAGKGFVVDAVNTSAAPSYMIVDTHASVSQVALQALMARADRIVQGR